MAIRKISYKIAILFTKYVRRLANLSQQTLIFFENILLG